MKGNHLLSKNPLTVAQAPKTKKEIAYDTLKEQIINTKLPPGTMLVERKLCAHLDISRTPIREAIQQLATEGLVEVLPGKGSVVSTIRYEDIAQIYDVREYIEGLGAHLAAKSMQARDLDVLENYLGKMEEFMEADTHHRKLLQIDNKFHEYILNCSRNAVLIDIYNSHLQAQIARITQLTDGRLGLIRRSHAYHVTLFNALKDRDSHRSEELIREHIRSAKEFLLEHFSPVSL